MAPEETYRDDVEMGAFHDSINEPDSPLPLPSDMEQTGRKPRWLSDRSQWRIVEVPTLLRPRLTWTYILFALLVLYILYCLIRQSPLLASKLPVYTGEHEVGAIDLEIPLDKPRKVSDTVFKATGKPAFELETVLFTVYYPAMKGARSSKPKHRWIPKPISLTAEGYAHIAKVNNFVMRPVFTFALWAIAGGIEIPANVDVPLLESGKKFPLMVFSHGMASSRTDYTHYCGELASHGYVVAAIEHRDGSSPGSFVILKDGMKMKRILFKKSQLLADPPIDTAKLKEEQLAFRTAEIEETVKVMRSINSNQGGEIYASNSRKEGTHINDWTNRLDFSQLTIGGHSYGATGALQALKGAPNGTIPAIGGIIMDPGKSSGPLNHDITVPILVVHSTSWSSTHSIFFGRPHFSTVKDLVLAVRKRVGTSWFMTSLGTSHPSVTDAPLIEPVLLSWTTGASIDVEEGVRQYVKVSLEFFDSLKSGKKSGVLAEKVTHEEYNEDSRSEERKKSMDKGISKYWQIHVA